MEVGTVPPQAPIGGFRGRMLALAKGASDRELITQIRLGNVAAFEALDDRYRAAILRYCRQLLSDPDEAEDAVQHTFLAAYTSIVTSDEDIDLRPWLYVIARNRCYSILRGRREVAMAELDHGTSEEPGTLVQRREDLRDLVLDVSRLPEDQRAALVMAELGAHSHDEIAGVLEVPRDKVKALVFQARESLVATRTAREIDCADIRRQLRTVRGGALRRGTLRRHLHGCPACREYRRQLRYQRAWAAAALPLAPVFALRDVLHRPGMVDRAAPAAGGAGTASAAIKVGALKSIAGTLAAMLSAASAVVAVHSMVPHHRVRAAGRPVVHHVVAHATPTVAVPGVTVRRPHVALATDRAHGATVRHAAVVRHPSLIVRHSAVGRTAWIDRRALRTVTARRRVLHSRVINVHRPHRTPPPSTPPPTIGGPPVPVPLLPPIPSLPQVPVAVLPVVPPLVVHGPNVPPGLPVPPNGGPGSPGDGHKPGDPGPGPHNKPLRPPVVNHPARPVPVPTVTPPRVPTVTPPRVPTVTPPPTHSAPPPLAASHII